MVAALVAAAAAGATITRRAKQEREQRAKDAVAQAMGGGVDGGASAQQAAQQYRDGPQTDKGLILMTILALVVGFGSIIIFSMLPEHKSQYVKPTTKKTNVGDGDDVAFGVSDSPSVASEGGGDNAVGEGGGSGAGAIVTAGYKYSPTRWVESYSYDSQLWNSNRITTTNPDGTTTTSERCNIPKIDASKISRDEFEDLYLEQSPVVLIRPTSTAAFRKEVQKEALLSKYGNYSVTLSSANRHSYAKREVSLNEYVKKMMGERGPQRLDMKGSDTWYHFGDNKHDEWEEVFNLYEKPTEYIYGQYASLSFGIGASGSGVPFHTHGHVFAEVLYGKKRWYLAPWEHEPPSDPDESTLQWLSNTYPTMDVDGLMTTPASPASSESFTKMKKKESAVSASSSTSLKRPEVYQFYECTLREGEMLYIPGRWHHSTLNLGETVFMSVFV